MTTTDVARDRGVGRRPAASPTTGRTGGSTRHAPSATALRVTTHAPRSARPRMSLTARGRTVVATLALVSVGVVGVVGLGTSTAVAGAPGAAVAVTSHTVAPGETLWAIARSVTEPGRDIRDTVAQVQRINGLPGVDLQAGQSILVPAP
jgi:LysM repeat protein